MALSRSLCMVSGVQFNEVKRHKYVWIYIIIWKPTISVIAQIKRRTENEAPAAAADQNPANKQTIQRDTSNESLCQQAVNVTSFRAYIIFWSDPPPSQKLLQPSSPRQRSIVTEIDG